MLIADDQALLRGSFRLLVDLSPDCTTVGEAGTGVEAVALTGQHRPDVVLMDVRMPEMDGIEATRRICADPATADTRVIILTTFDLDEYVYGALRAGASGFLLKDTPPADLLTGDPGGRRRGGAARADGDPPADRRVRPAAGADPAAAPAADGVTEREREVLALIARGLSNAELAAHLNLSQATVKTHVGRLLTKLAVRDRAQLVIVAYETGLVGPGGLR